MKRIVTLSTRKLTDTVKHGGCGACQTSCQSACKTSCGVANQKCETHNEQIENEKPTANCFPDGDHVYPHEQEVKAPLTEALLYR